MADPTYLTESIRLQQSNIDREELAPEHLNDDNDPWVKMKKRIRPLPEEPVGRGLFSRG